MGECYTEWVCLWMWEWEGLGGGRGCRHGARRPVGPSGSRCLSGGRCHHQGELPALCHCWVMSGGGMWCRSRQYALVGQHSSGSQTAIWFNLLAAVLLLFSYRPPPTVHFTHCCTAYCGILQLFTYANKFNLFKAYFKTAKLENVAVHSLIKSSKKKQKQNKNKNEIKQHKNTFKRTLHTPEVWRVVGMKVCFLFHLSVFVGGTSSRDLQGGVCKRN